MIRLRLSREFKDYMIAAAFIVVTWFALWWLGVGRPEPVPDWMKTPYVVGMVVSFIAFVWPGRTRGTLFDVINAIVFAFGWPVAWAIILGVATFKRFFPERRRLA